MKLFALVEAYSDDDGNFGSEIRSIYKTKEEAIKALQARYEEVLTYFNDPNDDFDDEYYFDISEMDDIEVRREGHIEELDIIL